MLSTLPCRSRNTTHGAHCRSELLGGVRRKGISIQWAVSSVPSHHPSSVHIYPTHPNLSSLRLSTRPPPPNHRAHPSLLLTLHQSRGVLQHPSHARYPAVWFPLVQLLRRHRGEIRPCRLPGLRAANLRRRSDVSWNLDARERILLVSGPVTAPCSRYPGSWQCRRAMVYEVCGGNCLRQGGGEMVHRPASEPVSCHVLCFKDASEYVRLCLDDTRATVSDPREVYGVQDAEEREAATTSTVSTHARGSRFSLRDCHPPPRPKRSTCSYSNEYL